MEKEVILSKKFVLNSWNFNVFHKDQKAYQVTFNIICSCWQEILYIYNLIERGNYNIFPKASNDDVYVN